MKGSLIGMVLAISLMASAAWRLDGPSKPVANIDRSVVLAKLVQDIPDLKVVKSPHSQTWYCYLTTTDQDWWALERLPRVDDGDDWQGSVMMHGVLKNGEAIAGQTFFGDPSLIESIRDSLSER